MPLFTATELGDSLQAAVTEAAADSAERRVWGWLKPVLGLAERPEPVPDEVWSWAIELGAIAYENPSGQSSDTRGPFTRQWDPARKTQILEAAAGSVAGGSAPGSPCGSFPPAAGWPDPVTSYGLPT